MAIYHFSMKIIGRTAGRDSTAAAAYRAADKIYDKRTGLTHNYLSRKQDIVAEEIIMPYGSKWKPSRSELWNAVETANTRKDSQTAREIEVALPAELSDEQRYKLVRGFCLVTAMEFNVAQDFAIHRPRAENNNHHAHILLTTNAIEGDGIGQKNRDMNSRETLEKFRESWEAHVNMALERAGHKERVDRRTLQEQGIEREATQHEGVAVAALERKGIKTRVREENARRKAQEQKRQNLESELKELQTELEKAEAEPPAPVDYAAIFVEYTRNRWRDAGKKFISENSHVAEIVGNLASQPKLIEIHEYETVQHEDGAIFYHPKGESSKVVFADRETKVEVFNKTDKTIVETLQLAAQKWEGGFKIEGSDEFRSRAEVLAQRYDLFDKILNPLKPVSLATEEKLRTETKKTKPSVPVAPVETVSPIGEEEAPRTAIQEKAKPDIRAGSSPVEQDQDEQPDQGEEAEEYEEYVPPPIDDVRVGDFKDMRQQIIWNTPDEENHPARKTARSMALALGNKPDSERLNQRNAERILQAYELSFYSARDAQRIERGDSRGR